MSLELLSEGLHASSMPSWTSENRGGLSSGASPMTEPFTRNLVIVHTPSAQQISDWLTVKETIAARGPEIDVSIVENGKPHPEIEEWQVSRPSLVFSPCTLSSFRPAGGKVYTGRAIDKLEQVRRLAAAGIPTPRSIPLTPELHLNAADWGAYVLVKPMSEKFWAGMLHRLARPETINSRYMELTRNGRLEMLVQNSHRHERRSRMSPRVPSADDFRAPALLQSPSSPCAPAALGGNP